MKKIIFTLALLANSLLFAQPYNEQHPKDKAIYCPPEITCENKACSFDSKYKKYFGILSIVGKNDGSPFAKSYAYQSTTATFHSNSLYGRCHYGMLDLEIKPSANLEAYRVVGSSWPSQKTQETCSGNCPLHENRGFAIINTIYSGGVYASISQYDLTGLITENYRVLFDDTLPKCADVKECAIELLSEQRKTYGYIIVDMENMQILEARSIDPAIQISKESDLNTVKIKKINVPQKNKLIYCPPAIKCQNKKCTYASLDAKYFSDLKIPDAISNEIQSIPFVYANYYSDNSMIYCRYSTDPNKYAAILKIDPLYHVDVHSGAGVKWSPVNSSVSSCISNTGTAVSTQECPFKKKLDVVINNKNISNGLYGSVPSTYTSKLLLNNSFLNVTFNDISSGCYGKTECNIDVLSSKYALYGSVTINPKTMRILQIKSLYPQYIDMHKISTDGFDTVAVNYIVDLKLIPSYLL